MQKWFIFTSLVLISLFSVALVAVRVLYSGQISYLFLIWNLLLAWLPLVFAWVAFRWNQRILPVLSMAFLWVLFFPNAPYLVTDLIHLREIPPVPLWYDLILLFNFALLGLFLGFVSLRIMQSLVNGRFGVTISWVFVMAVLALSGLGIYIGRFLRWNSWDLFFRPFSLFKDVWANLYDPRTLAISGLLALLLLFAYFIFAVIPGQLSGLQQATRKPPAL